MAHSTLHYTLGMAVGAVIGAKPLLSSWISNKKLSIPFLKWLLVTHAFGVWAIIPSLMRNAGVADYLCDTSLTNIFVFHSFIDKTKIGANTIGPMLMFFLLAIQYILLVLAINKTKKNINSPSS